MLTLKIKKKKRISWHRAKVGFKESVKYEDVLYKVTCVVQVCCRDITRVWEKSELAAAMIRSVRESRFDLLKAVPSRISQDSGVSLVLSASAARELLSVQQH